MKMGMIWQVCEAEQLEDKTNELAVKLASMPTRGFALTKRALNASMNNGLNQQLNYEEDLQRQAGNTYDYKEGIVAFYERREPMFRGF
jgi:2-(1,2-epoxy-1,2-dihydrophenyl)acetyl-CoA isomerase